MEKSKCQRAVITNVPHPDFSKKYRFGELNLDLFIFVFGTEGLHGVGKIPFFCALKYHDLKSHNFF